MLALWWTDDSCVRILQFGKWRTTAPTPFWCAADDNNMMYTNNRRRSYIHAQCTRLTGAVHTPRLRSLEAVWLAFGTHTERDESKFYWLPALYFFYLFVVFRVCFCHAKNAHFNLLRRRMDGKKRIHQLFMIFFSWAQNVVCLWCGDFRSFFLLPPHYAEDTESLNIIWVSADWWTTNGILMHPNKSIHHKCYFCSLSRFGGPRTAKTIETVPLRKTERLN